MPRNLNRTQCQVPGCHNGAMHGRNHHRSHRGAQLSLRAVAAITAKPNALERGSFPRTAKKYWKNNYRYNRQQHQSSRWRDTDVE
jgi:hypothetical protein